MPTKKTSPSLEGKKMPKFKVPSTSGADVSSKICARGGRDLFLPQGQHERLARAKGRFS